MDDCFAASIQFQSRAISSPAAALRCTALCGKAPRSRQRSFFPFVHTFNDLSFLFLSQFFPLLGPNNLLVKVFLETVSQGNGAHGGLSAPGGRRAGVSPGDRKANPSPWTLRRDRAMVVDGKNGARGIQKEEVERAEEGVLMLVCSETRHFCFWTGFLWPHAGRKSSVGFFVKKKKDSGFFLVSRF